MIDSDDFHFEVIKLLVRIAFVDGELQASERQALLRYADRHGLGERAREALGRWLDGEKPAPPDLGLLRPRRQQVLIEVQSFLLSDVAMTSLERRLLARVEAALADD
jgi:hypothetical protein